VAQTVGVVGEVSRTGAAVECKAETPQKTLNETEKAELVTVFASLVGIVASRRPGGPGGPPPQKL